MIPSNLDWALSGGAPFLMLWNIHFLRNKRLCLQDNKPVGTGGVAKMAIFVVKVYIEY